jgi:hypothetical protein
LGIPDYEYPRTDLPSSFEHIGVLPTIGLQEEWRKPDWWDEMVDAHGQGKTIIVLTNSSAEFNIEETIFPALEGLKNRESTLVITTLVNFEPDQLEHKYPANARVARFIPLNLVLQYVRFLSLPCHFLKDC